MFYRPLHHSPITDYCNRAIRSMPILQVKAGSIHTQWAPFSVFCSSKTNLGALETNRPAIYVSDTQYKCIEYKAAGAAGPGTFYELHTSVPVVAASVVVNSHASRITETRSSVIL